RHRASADGRPSRAALRAGEGRRAGPRSVLVDVGSGRFVEGTPSQQARLDVARVWANWQIARVRSVDPRWRPQPGLSSTLEGEILQQQSVLRQGEAHLRSLRRRIGDNGGPPLELPPALPLRSAQEILTPGGRVLGYRFSGARPDIYTLSQSEFDAALRLLTNGRREILPPDSYPGVYYELPDRCVIGVRNSLRNGMTIDIIESGTRLPLYPKTKFRRR
ncbi:MAG: hypothetical protein H7Y08_09600, partial [Rhizobiaceae bacterium]|nr:hypothetical protein [Rhizobiaceae bacterium]